MRLATVGLPCYPCNVRLCVPKLLAGTFVCPRTSYREASCFLWPSTVSSLDALLHSTAWQTDSLDAPFITQFMSYASQPSNDLSRSADFIRQRHPPFRPMMAELGAYAWLDLTTSAQAHLSSNHHRRPNFSNMGSFYDEMPDWLMAWIAKQHLFFVATAPTNGHVNVSPKGE